MKRLLILLSVVLSSTACEQDIATDPMVPVDLPQSDVISDAANGGAVEGFYFLSPIVPTPTTTGTFNPLVGPKVVICKLDPGATPAACGTAAADTVAVYTLTSGTDGATISMSETDEHYQVNWKATNFTLDSQATYRISVFLTVYPGALELGYADVQVADNGGQLKNIATSEYIALVDNQTLPIKFRIEAGAGCEGTYDCGSGTIGPEGGVVTSANGTAGVSFPAGAVDNPITVTIRQLDPAMQPGGTCLPTGIRQDGACYDFDTVEEISAVQDDGADTFHQLVTVAICPSPNAVREDRLTLHKYNPERADEGVVELDGTAQTFLDCSGLSGPGYVIALAAPTFMERLAQAAGRALRPVASAFAPTKLFAKDPGLAGLTDSFSRITWAESIALSTSAFPGSAAPGAVVTGTISGLTAHNHDVPPTAATDARLRFDYTDPDGNPSSWHATTDSNGQVAASWELTSAPGVHTLVVSSRAVDPSIAGTPLIDDPTTQQTVQLVVCQSGLDCGLGVVSSNGGVVTTSDGSAGVFVPADAVLSPVTIVIQQLDPADQPGGLCLPSGIRQDGACYDFDTLEEIEDVTGGSPTFLTNVTVAICERENAVRPDRLTLHKYNPERAEEGVVELEGTGETFLDCSNLSGPGYAAVAAPTFLGRLAQAAGRALRPVASVLAPTSLFAKDPGLAGLTDSFSRITWAESLTLSASGLPGSASPGATVTGTISGVTAHNHDGVLPTAATDARLRFHYTDAAGAESVWYETTGEAGDVPLSWTLSQTTGTHQLVVTTRGHDTDLSGDPLIVDPTDPVLVQIQVGAEQDCAGCTVTVEPNPLTITVDREYALSATALTGTGAPLTGTITWESSNPSVATVDASGLVTGVTAGEATISASISGVQGTAEVTVLPAGSVGGITGTVRNAATGAALVDAQVQIAGTTLAAVTNVNGVYTFSDVPAGMQTINVTMSGFFGESRLVTVPQDGTTTENFDLTPSIAIDG